MTHPFAHTADAKPFIIEHLRLDDKPGSFTPAARLIITEELRNSGLITAFSDKLAATLLTLLTYCSPNGVVEVTAEEFAETRAITLEQAETALKDLMSIRIDGLPIVEQIEREQSLTVYRLSHQLLLHIESLCPEGSEQVRFASRQEVIEHSRSTYGHPRAEVEEQVATLLGHSVEESRDTAEGEARRRLLTLGVEKEEVSRLVADYPILDILQQLDWLPLRGARKPARYIVAAIENGYAEPLRLRFSRQRIEEPEQHEETDLPEEDYESE